MEKSKQRAYGYGRGKPPTKTEPTDKPKSGFRDRPFHEWKAGFRDPFTDPFKTQEAATFDFLLQARSANLRASFAPRSRHPELMSQSSCGQ
jgi:hypothetical protein